MPLQRACRRGRRSFAGTKKGLELTPSLFVGRDRRITTNHPLGQDMRRTDDIASRLGAHGVDRVAGGEGVCRIHRARWQFAVDAAAQVRLQVGARAIRGVGALLALFQGPLLLGRVNQPEVVDAGILL